MFQENDLLILVQVLQSERVIDRNKETSLISETK